MIQISVCLTNRAGRLRDQFDWAAMQRVDAVEVDARRQLTAGELGATARRQIRQLLRERNLKLSGLQFPLKGELADEPRLADRIDAVVAAMSLGYDVGAASLVIPFVLPSEDVDGEDVRRERTSEVLRHIAQAGDRSGCRPMLRLGGDAEAVQAFVREAGCGDLVDIQLDPVACLTSDETLEAAFESHGPQVRQVRVMDATRSGSGLARETTVGRGEVDFDLLAALASQVNTQAAVVAPENTSVAPLEDAIEFSRAVFRMLP